MSVLGRAFLGIWHGVEPEWRDEYDAWHTYEHMPERSGIPGFRRGRRYINYDLDPHVCFTLYEGSHVETFRSPGYLARLNAPTEWTQQVQPHMPNFVRGVFLPLISLGEGVGGAMGTIRIVNMGDPKHSAKRLINCAHAIAALRGVCGVHIGEAMTEVAAAPTKESEVRGHMDQKTDDFVVLIEGISTVDLTKRWGDIMQLVEDAGQTNVKSNIYPLAYSLTADGQ